MLYFDNAATTKPFPSVTADIMQCLMFDWYNPSSIYEEGKKAKRIVETARKQTAEAINALPEEIIFTSGGSESNNLALKGYVENYDADLIFTTKIEHPSVYNTCKYLKDNGTRVIYIPVNSNGIIDMGYFEHMVAVHGHTNFIVSIMFANNEIGTIQPIKEIGEIVHKYNGILHVDAVQAFLHINIDVKTLGIDLMSVSGHKFGCPKGVGFLYKKKDIELSPIIHGGHQEHDMRAGTENVPYIYAMGNQIEKMSKKNLSEYDLMGAYLRGLIQEYCSPTCEIVLNGSVEPEECLWNILSVTFKGIDADTLITMLNDRGVCISAGSACCAGEKTPSRVLKAIGLSDIDASHTVRISLSWDTTVSDCMEFVEKLRDCINFLSVT